LHNVIIHSVFLSVNPGVGGKADTFLANTRRDLAAGVATPSPITRPNAHPEAQKAHKSRPARPEWQALAARMQRNGGTQTVLKPPSNRQ
jgi:hypothetical protein